MKKFLIQFYLSKYIYFFFLASFGGWLWEVMIFLMQDGSFHNRGFLYGPCLPVYGIGAVLFYVLLHRLQHRPVVVFLLSLLLGSGLELLIGFFLDACWQLRYWDYTNYFMNFHGYICLYSALGFGIAGTAWVCLLSDFLFRLYTKIPAPRRRGFHTLLVLIFVVDCAAALIFPNKGTGVTF